VIAASLSYSAFFRYSPSMIAPPDHRQGDTGLHKVTGGNTFPLDIVNRVNFGAWGGRESQQAESNDRG